MQDDTIITSMKLTAGSKFQDILEPITVMAFTYQDDNDFDTNGYYRGNSKKIVKVYNQ